MAIKLENYEVLIEHPDVTRPKKVLKTAFEKGTYPGWKLKEAPPGVEVTDPASVSEEAPASEEGATKAQSTRSGRGGSGSTGSED